MRPIHQGDDWRNANYSTLKWSLCGLYWSGRHADEMIAPDGEAGKWRKARKSHTCDYNRGSAHGGMCRAEIPAGSQYYDTMEHNGEAGGFGTDRICADCAATLGYFVTCWLCENKPGDYECDLCPDCYWWAEEQSLREPDGRFIEEAELKERYRKEIKS